MRIGESLGVNPISVQMNTNNTLIKMSEFSRSNLESAGGSQKDGPGIVSKAFSAILSIPMMIINGAWTLVKYTIYFATLGICCKPDYDPKALKAALEKVIGADDKKAAWTQFTKNYPRATDQLIKFAVEQIRIAQIGEKDNMDPVKATNWNKDNLARVRKELKERFDTQDTDLLTQAVDYLQQMIDAKAKK